MASKEMIIKLMIDPKSNRLIYAEASKDFVDFLIFLLSLPIGTVVKLLTSESMVGSIGNIYTSVANNLNKTNLKPNVHKSLLLNPMVSSSGKSISVTESSIVSSSGKLYSYVQEENSYIVMDDLSITSISTTKPILTLMNKFNVSKLVERKVKIGTKEVLELMKASFQSTTVISDVFLKVKKEEQQGHSTEKKGKEPENCKKRKKEEEESESESSDESETVNCKKRKKVESSYSSSSDDTSESESSDESETLNCKNRKKVESSDFSSSDDTSSDSSS